MLAEPWTELSVQQWQLAFQGLSVALQLLIIAIFIGSLIVGYLNLVAFQHSNNVNLLKHLLDEYNGLVATGVFDAYPRELLDWRETLAESELTPHTFYYLHLKSLSRVGQYFDYLGLLVEKGILEFELLFEVIPFPDKFWDDTESFRAEMQAVTYSNFWEHFNSLRKAYVEARSHLDKPKKKGWLLTRSHLKPVISKARLS